MLAIAGSDPSGGAGIQADLKSIAAHGGYGMAAITALTAQNTRGVSAVHVPPAAFLTAQLEAISEDITIDAVKIGMLGDAAVIDAVRSWLEKVRPAVVVLDPVMVATSGDRLLQESAEAALHALLPLADLITPNLAELAILLREPAAADWAEALEQGKRLAALTGTTVLVKGGHLGRSRRTAGGDDAAARMRWSTPGGCSARTCGGAGGAGRHPQQPRHRLFAVLGHGHRAGPGGGLGGRAAGGQALAAGRAARLGGLDVGTGNGPVHHFHHVQQPPQDHGAAPRDRRPGRPRASSPRRSGKRPPPTWRPSTAWTSSAAWPTERCRRRSSPTTSPRTPSTSTAIPGCWPVPPRSRPPRPSSCSGPGRRRMPGGRVGAAPDLAQHPHGGA